MPFTFFLPRLMSGRAEWRWADFSIRLMRGELKPTAWGLQHHYRGRKIWIHLAPATIDSIARGHKETWQTDGERDWRQRDGGRELLYKVEASPCSEGKKYIYIYISKDCFITTILHIFLQPLAFTEAQSLATFILNIQISPAIVTPLQYCASAPNFRLTVVHRAVPRILWFSKAAGLRRTFPWIKSMISLASTGVRFQSRD